MIDVAAGKPVWAVGVMTGTSMDGVDVASILTDGETIEAFGEIAFEDFTEAEGTALRAAIAQASRSIATRDDVFDAMLEAPDGAALKHIFPEVYSALNRAICAAVAKVPTAAVSAIGVHGQTVAHAPFDGLTMQLLCPQALFEQTRRDVVWDFRSQDVAAGGQGAPLAPFYHFALARYIGATQPIAFLNIGGVANVTWVDPSKSIPTAEGALVAFDTGPGNALVNDWMAVSTGAKMDQGGHAAATGRVFPEQWASNSGRAYLDAAPPKSLDRNDFYPVLKGMEGLSVEDGAATLTAFTADCVASAIHHLPSPPLRWLVCGGGRHNETMMRMLEDRLGVSVAPVEAVGLDGDMLEAQAFAYLAIRVKRGLPTSCRMTTGCSEPVCGGRIQRAG